MAKNSLRRSLSAVEDIVGELRVTRVRREDLASEVLTEAGKARACCHIRNFVVFYESVCVRSFWHLYTWLLTVAVFYVTLKTTVVLIIYFVCQHE